MPSPRGLAAGSRRGVPPRGHVVMPRTGGPSHDPNARSLRAGARRARRSLESSIDRAPRDARCEARAAHKVVTGRVVLVASSAPPGPLCESHDAISFRQELKRSDRPNPDPRSRSKPAKPFLRARIVRRTGADRGRRRTRHARSDQRRRTCDARRVGRRRGRRRHGRGAAAERRWDSSPRGKWRRDLPKPRSVPRSSVHWARGSPRSPAARDGRRCSSSSPARH